MQSLTIAESKKVVISGLTSLNSELFHIAQQHPETGRDHHGPGHSPNTDGIHIQKSSDVAVIDTRIETGDDCIPMGEGSTNDWIEKIDCGAGHGIRCSSPFLLSLSPVSKMRSIGSLGSTPSEAGMQNITVTSVAFSGTENGLRIN
ncbi:hypothetical protein C4D60_Mb09t02380 [Musa balbisiana]|uniref:Polygalacturonase n=1 Tax=Musa balbisiana TaxID=52838 RepID=A0A4S8IET0_MUSBA|nr:hypothetical protein C4D60_Mb09t02380 [Musa balbisiana]